jgi:hypothetical protein
MSHPEQFVNVPVAPVLKARLKAIASAQALSLADVARAAFFAYIEKHYPRLVKAGKIQED